MADTDRPMYSKTSGLPIYRKSNNALIWGDDEECDCCICLPCADGTAQPDAVVTKSGTPGDARCDKVIGTYTYAGSTRDCHWWWEMVDADTHTWTLHVWHCRDEVGYGMCALIECPVKGITFGCGTDSCPCENPPYTSTTGGWALSCNEDKKFYGGGNLLGDNAYDGDPCGSTDCDGLTASVSIVP